MAAKNTEIVETPTGNSLPAYLQARQHKAGAGLEGIKRQEAQAVPRLLLSQALSPHVVSGDAQPADYWHNVDEKVVSSGRQAKSAEGGRVLPGLEVIPIYVFESAILFAPRETQMGMLAKSRDMVTWQPSEAEFRIPFGNGREVLWNTSTSIERSRLLEWGSSDPSDPRSKPAGTAYINAICYCPGIDSELKVAVLSFSRSAYKVGQKFVTALRSRPAAPWACRFRLSSKELTGPKGTFFVPALEGIGFVDETTYQLTEQLYRQFRDKTDIDIHGEGDDDPEDEAAGPRAGADNAAY